MNVFALRRLPKTQFADINTTHIQIAHYLKDVRKRNVIIIDSDDLLSDPESMLKAYCQEVGLTYNDNMLQWKVDNDMWWNWMLPRSTFLK